MEEMLYAQRSSSFFRFISNLSVRLSFSTEKSTSLNPKSFVPHFNAHKMKLIENRISSVPPIKKKKHLPLPTTIRTI